MCNIKRKEEREVSFSRFKMFNGYYFTQDYKIKYNQIPYYLKGHTTILGNYISCTAALVSTKPVWLGVPRLYIQVQRDCTLVQVTQFFSHKVGHCTSHVF